MYETCWIGLAPALELVIVVLALICIGLVAAVARQTESARHYRDLFGEARENMRILRLQNSALRFEMTFGKRD